MGTHSKIGLESREETKGEAIWEQIGKDGAPHGSSPARLP